MKRVITISLNGNAFQLEEDASAALADYLDAAARALRGNPDREEILGDLEQAIADKCGRFLGPHKSVLRLVELQQVIAEMGPVEGEAGGEPAAAGAAGGAPAGDAGQAAGSATPGAGARASGTAGSGSAGSGAAPGGPAPRRLYQISEGAVISGLCNGMAAWLGVDVTPVRVVAVLLAFLTGGMAALVYAVLMFIVPYASTSEERAAAHGLPFNARVLVERAKQKYSQFACAARDPAARAGWRKEWRREWRHARAEMRHGARQARAEWRASRCGTASSATPANIAARTITGIVMAVVGVLVAALTVAWVLGLVSFVTTGTLFGWSLPFQAPFWIALVAMFLLFGVFTAPLRMLRTSSRGDAHPGPWAALAALEGLLGVVFLVAVLWYASHHTAEIREFIEYLRSTFLNRPASNPV